MWSIARPWSTVPHVRASRADTKSSRIPALRHDVAKDLGAPLPIHLDRRPSERVHRERRDDGGGRVGERDQHAAARPDASRRELVREGTNPGGQITIGQPCRGTCDRRRVRATARRGSRASRTQRQCRELARRLSRLHETACHRYPRRILPAGGHAVDSGRPHVTRPVARAHRARIRLEPRAMFSRNVLRIDPRAGGQGDRGDHPRGRPW